MQIDKGCAQVPQPPKVLTQAVFQKATGLKGIRQPTAPAAFPLILVSWEYQYEPKVELKHKHCGEDG